MEGRLPVQLGNGIHGRQTTRRDTYTTGMPREYDVRRVVKLRSVPYNQRRARRQSPRSRNRGCRRMAARCDYKEGLENMCFCETNRIGFGVKTGGKILRRSRMRRKRVKISIRFVWNGNEIAACGKRAPIRGTRGAGLVSNVLYETACQQAGDGGSIRRSLE